MDGFCTLECAVEFRLLQSSEQAPEVVEKLRSEITSGLLTSRRNLTSDLAMGCEWQKQNPDQKQTSQYFHDVSTALLLGKPSGAVGADGSRTETKMALVHIVFATSVLPDFFIRFPQYPGSRIGERLGVELGILDQRLDMDVIAIRPGPALHDMQCIAVGVGILIDPDFL